MRNKIESKKDLFRKAKERGYSIGAFNVFNMITAEAVVQASNELSTPVIIQMSMSTVKSIGINKATAMLEAVISDAKQEIYYHLDHCTDIDFAKRCVRAGWQSIMFDGSALDFEENIRRTKEVVDYAKEFDVLVEGEIGVIQGVEDHVQSDFTKLATYDEVTEYINLTNVQSIAPSIGTAHGLYEGSPNINYDMIRRLSVEQEHPVVIHGGTGLEYDDYQKLVQSGGAKINVSTAIKHAYIDTMKKIVEGDLVYDPMSYDRKLVNGVKEVVKNFIAAFKLEDLSKVG